MQRRAQSGRRPTCTLAAVTIALLPAVLAAKPYESAQGAIADAAARAAFACVIFHNAQDSVPLKAMARVVQEFNKSRQKKVVLCEADMAVKGNAETAAKYGVDGRQALPLLLVIAPNGVVTGGHPGSVTPEQLKQDMSVSELMLRVLKPLQEQKVVLVALQNQATSLNAESWQGVNDFAQDSLYKRLVSAIKADPAAAGSAEFLKQCQLVPHMTTATVVVLMPPGRIAKVITGKTTKEDLLKSLIACSPGGGGGCCSDLRFKENITPIDSALDKVTRLQGVRYTWDRDNHPFRNFPQGSQVGLIAQEVEQVVPEVVRTDSAGYKYVYYDRLTAVLVEAVKELRAHVAVQDSVIAAQNARIRSLETAR